MLSVGLTWAVDLCLPSEAEVICKTIEDTWPWFGRPVVVKLAWREVGIAPGQLREQDTEDRMSISVSFLRIVVLEEV